jgi:hypothetical protein
VLGLKLMRGMRSPNLSCSLVLKYFSMWYKIVHSDEEFLNGHIFF